MHSQQVLKAYPSWSSTFMWLCCRFGGFCDNVDSFDAELFRFSPAEAAATDPAQRILMEQTLLALSDAATRLGTDVDSFTGTHSAKSSHPSAMSLSVIYMEWQHVLGENPCHASIIPTNMGFAITSSGPDRITLLQGGAIALTLSMQAIVSVRLDVLVQACMWAACTTNTLTSWWAQGPPSLRRPSSATALPTWYLLLCCQISQCRGIGSGL